MTNQNPSGSGERNRTLWLLAATAVLTAAALIVGISDNLPGIALLYAAGLTLVLSWTHRWRSARKYGFLFLWGILAFFVLAVVHNFAEVGAHRLAELPVIPILLSTVSVVGFLAALIVCPMAVLVGGVGWVANLKRGVGEPA